MTETLQTFKLYRRNFSVEKRGLGDQKHIFLHHLVKTHYFHQYSAGTEHTTLFVCIWCQFAMSKIEIVNANQQTLSWFSR